MIYNHTRTSRRYGICRRIRLLYRSRRSPRPWRSWLNAFAARERTPRPYKTWDSLPPLSLPPLPPLSPPSRNQCSPHSADTGHNDLTSEASFRNIAYGTKNRYWTHSPTAATRFIDDRGCTYYTYCWYHFILSGVFRRSRAERKRLLLVLRPRSCCRRVRVTRNFRSRSL